MRYYQSKLLQSTLGNVLAELHALELDSLDTLISTSDSVFESRTSGSRSDDTTTTCHELAILDVCAGVEDDSVLGSSSQSHGGALGVGSRVATSSDNDSSSSTRRNLDRTHRGERVCGTAVHELGKVRLEQSQDGLGFRVTEADVVLENLGAGLGHHEAGEKTADEDVARVAHAIDGCLQDGLVDFLVLLGRDDTSRSVGAHTASVGTLVVVKDTLVVLGRRQTSNVVAIAEGQDAALFADQQLLDDNRVAGRAELARQHDVLEGLYSLFLGLRDDDTLASSEAVGLDDNIVIDAVEVCLCLLVVAEVLVCGSGDVVVLHEVLAEGLAAFHTGSSLVGTEALDIGELLGEEVDNAGDKRGLGTRDQEVDVVVASEVDQGGEVVGLEIGDVGDLVRDTVRLRLSMRVLDLDLVLPMAAYEGTNPAVPPLPGTT